MSNSCEMDTKIKIKKEDPLSEDVASQNEGEFFSKNVALKTNNDAVYLDNYNVTIKTEINTEAPFPDYCLQNERECVTKYPIKEIKSETVTHSNMCQIDIKTEIEEQTQLSDFGSQNEGEFLPEVPVIMSSDHEMDNKGEINKELWWPERETTSVCGDVEEMTGKKRKCWSEENMRKAVESVRNKEMGFLKASKLFQVPKSTLLDYVKAENLEEKLGSRIGRKCALRSDLEKELSKYCQVMDERFYGLRTRDIRILAYQLAVQNNVTHPFASDKHIAGKKWLRGFLKRHPMHSFRKPELISIARAKGFTKEKVSAFFNILHPELQKVNFHPSKIYNVDETGICVVQGTRSKVLSVKGKKQVARLSSAERDSLITVVTCMNAAGTFVPPLIVFPRVRMKPELLKGTSPGTVMACHPSGWIQTHIFTQWLHHFIRAVKPSCQDPVVLILDIHYSHTRNLDVIQLGREHGVILVCLPPHCTHKLQPLDVSFMGPFKRFYSQEIDLWLDNHPFQAVTMAEVGEIFGKAYVRAANMQTAINGFKKCGIIPLNPNVFADVDFLPQETTAREKTEENEACEDVEDSAVIVSPFQMRPPQEKLKCKRAIVEELEKSSKRGRYKNNQKGSQKNTKVAKMSVQQRRSRCESSSEEESESSVSLVSTDDEDSADEECIYCSVPYREDKSGEDWIRCLGCLRWVHELCAGTEKHDWKTYKCENCKC